MTLSEVSRTPNGGGVSSSLSRLNNEKMNKATLRFARFYKWVKQSNEILPYITDDDQILAIAQHYGLATPLIDFTSEPDVAGFFANERNHDASHGCIFMIDQADFNSLMTPLIEDEKIAHFLCVDVQHLWRLQAQHGFFLEISYCLEKIYPPDRIIFPHVNDTPTINRKLIYPENESHLEMYINDYFKQERMEDGFYNLIMRSNFNVIYDEGDEKKITLESAHHFDWPADPLWQSIPDERWVNILATLNVNPPAISKDEILEDGLERLIESSRNKTRLLTWVSTTGYDTEEEQKWIDRIWSGMRLLPYSDAQIAQAIRSTSRIRSDLKNIPPWNLNDVFNSMNKLIHDLIEIEIGIVNGTTTRVLLSANMLIDAIRHEVILEATTLSLNSGTEQLGWVLSNRYAVPRRTFDRDQLVNLFATAIIPWQVGCERPFVVYSPYHITNLGRP